MTNAQMVAEFHRAFGHTDPSVPTADIGPEGVMRMRLIAEEFDEYAQAFQAGDIVEMADALADLLYVTYGAALYHGIPIDRVFAEVHRSNMTKLGEDGKPILRDDGKFLKGPNYELPDIAGALNGRHVDQFRGVAAHHTGEFVRRLDEGTRDFEHFAEHHPEGHDNGYTVTTPPHSDVECEAAAHTSRYAP